jgi:hypothetical protein
LEQGWKVYEQLRNINKETPLEHTLIKISRTGAGQNDTNYFAMPVKPVTPDIAKQIESLALIDLRVTPQDESDSPGSKTSVAPSTDVPF